MTRKRTLSNGLLIVVVLFLCIPGIVAGEDISLGDDSPRSFADVPSWITGEIEVYTPDSLGYSVNGMEYRNGYSLQNRVPLERDAAEVPLWIQLAGVSGILVFLITMLHFMPIAIGRITKANPSPVRDSIYSAICENPGFSSADIKKTTGVHYETLRYHLAVLEKEQKILSRKLGRSYHYFPNGSTLSYTDTIRLTLCQNPTTGKILGIIETEPGISGTVLAARAGITAGTLTWHLGRLEENNLITISRSGRGMQIFPAVHT